MFMHSDRRPGEKKGDGKDDEKIVGECHSSRYKLCDILISSFKPWTRATFRSSRPTYVGFAYSLLLPLTPLQGQGPYAEQLKKIENDIKEIQKRINEKLGMYILLSRGLGSTFH